MCKAGHTPCIHSTRTHRRKDHLQAPAARSHHKQGMHCVWKKNTLCPHICTVCMAMEQYVSRPRQMPQKKNTPQNFSYILLYIFTAFFRLFISLYSLTCCCPDQRLHRWCDVCEKDRQRGTRRTRPHQESAAALAVLWRGRHGRCISSMYLCACACVRVWVCACVACVACARACVRACVRAWVVLVIFLDTV